MAERGHKRVALLLPWVGRRPWYWALWEKSAEGRSFDIVVVEKSLEEFSALVCEKLGKELPDAKMPFRLHAGYKLCDLKPMYGVLFSDALKSYDYWAFGDCDVLYGRRMDDWIGKALAGDYDIATVQQEFCAGPFTMVKNCEKCNHLFMRTGGWREMLAKPQVMSFDELGENWFRRHIHGGLSYEDLRRVQDSFSATVWSEAAAGRLNLLAEPVIREDMIGADGCRLESNGALELGGEEIALYHFIAAKNRFGFAADGTGVKISCGWPWWRDALRFGFKMAKGDRAAWYRASECVQRKLGMQGWKSQFAWNNRIYKMPK